MSFLYSMRMTARSCSFPTKILWLIWATVVPLSGSADLPKTPFPLGNPSLTEARAFRELRPGLTHVRVERGSWPKDGPPKYTFLKPADQPPAEFRACMEHAGYTVREHRFGWSEGEAPISILIAGEFNTVEDARQASRKIPCKVEVTNPSKFPDWDTGPYVLNIVIVDPKVYQGKIISSWSEKAWRASPMELARKHNAVVAVNGSFFEYSMDEIGGVPTATSIVQGEWHHEPNNRPGALYIDNKDNGRITLSINETPPKTPEFKWIGANGNVKSIRLDGIDRMPKNDELVAMRPTVADTAPISHSTPSHILLRQIGGDGYLAPGYFRAPSGLVLMATGAKQAALREAIESGKPVDLDLRVPGHPGLNGWYVSPILIKNSQPTKGLGVYRLSRTAIGADAEGKIYLISVDGADPDLVQAGGPVGAGEDELLAIAKFLGLINAANLDGGGRSTSMVVEGKVLSHDSQRHLQSPYDDDRRVGDAVLVIDDE